MALYRVSFHFNFNFNFTYNQLLDIAHGLVAAFPGAAQVEEDPIGAVEPPALQVHR
jgi:hypothetical protein